MPPGSVSWLLPAFRSQRNRSYRSLVVCLTRGLARTLFTHSVSPRTDTKYFTPSTSTGVIGIVCGNLLPRLITVSGWLLIAPVANAIRLKILAKNHEGLT
jgi:hypothetical protein